MNRTEKTASCLKLATLLTLVSTSSTYGVTALADITWGNKLSGNSSIFADSAGLGFSDGSAVVAIGGFTSLPSFQPNPSTFDNFVVVAESSDFNDTIAGLFTQTSDNLDTSAWSSVIGNDGYIAVAKGASSFSNLGTATEFGVWTSSSWDPLPSGVVSPGTPQKYAAELTDVGVDYSTLVGSVDPNGGVSGGNAYKTQAIPEPSAYATILGLLGLGYAVFSRRRRSSS